MSEATGTASPGGDQDEQFLKTFDNSNLQSTQLFSEVSEVDIVQSSTSKVTSDMIKQEIHDHDDVNSIETLSASECDDEEVINTAAYNNSTGTSGALADGKLVPRFPGSNMTHNGFNQINGINSDDLRELIDTQLDYTEDFSQVNNNLSDLSQADVDYIKQQHQEAMSQGLLPAPGTGGRGRSRANKTGPPPVEPLTQEQLQSLQQGSGK